MSDPFLLDKDLTVTDHGRDGLLFQRRTDEYVGGQLLCGSAHVDEDNVLVLVVCPSTSANRRLEEAESEAWQRDAEEYPVWAETATYRWEYAPGPWLDQPEDSEAIAVMSEA